MIELSPERIVAATGAEVAREGRHERPARAVIDSRQTRPGDLFFGLEGEHADGGEYAAAALAAGAWGVVVDYPGSTDEPAARTARRPCGRCGEVVRRGSKPQAGRCGSNETISYVNVPPGAS